MRHSRLTEASPAGNLICNVKMNRQSETTDLDHKQEQASRENRKRCRNWWAAGGFAVVVLVLMVYLLQWIGLHFAGSLLVMQHEPRTADVIVILGGESKNRVDRAVELYRRGYAPRILVAGRNEETLIARRLIETGVPESAIWLESSSKNTFENATYSVAILNQWHAKRVLLVTSWFHSRRAASVFRGTSEMIEFISIPTDTISVEELNKDKWLRDHVLLEYVKIAGYWLKYGISPLSHPANMSAHGTGI